MLGCLEPRKGDVRMLWKGGCLCGHLRYEASGDPIWVGHCHCRWCQKHSGAAFVTGVMFKSSQVRWLTASPAAYVSSHGIERGFCPACGSTMTFARLDHEEVALYAGTLDDPNSICPEEHIFVDQRCSWLRMNDGLPSHGRFPTGYEDREPR